MKKIKQLKIYKTQTYTDETMRTPFKVFEDYNTNEIGDKVNEIIERLNLAPSK